VEREVMSDPQDQPTRDAGGSDQAVSRRIDLPTGLSITFGCRPVTPPLAAEPDQSNRPRTSPVSIRI
jgi:hypothetical protein